MKIIRVEPTEKIVSLTWMIGAQCNYDCMYCPSWFHNNDRPHHTFEDLKTTWLNFYSATCDKNLPYKISFTGGEVTANKNFLPLIEFLQQQNVSIRMLLTTNGSASERYYRSLAKLVDSISFSTHSEFFDEQKFFDKVLVINQQMIRPEKSVHVNIMDEYWNKNRIELYKQLLDANNVSYSVNTIDYTAKIRNFPMQKGQLNLVGQQ
jgi:MoaA/NifB/PqqE/SkfB family radical SAM enzyme